MTMDRAIFDMNASVEATSLYILLCALGDEGNPVTLETARQRWNSSEEDLMNGARELMHLGVIIGEEPLSHETPLHIQPRSHWQPPAHKTLQ